MFQEANTENAPNADYEGGKDPHNSLEVNLIIFYYIYRVIIPFIQNSHDYISVAF
jgi:hypothetical protein